MLNLSSLPARASARLIRTAPKLLIPAAATLAASAMLAAAPAAASTAADTYSLSSGLVARSAGGHTWELSVDFQSGATTSIPATLDIQIIRAAGTGQLEDHVWTFDVPNSSLSFSGGDAKLNAGASVSPLVTVDVGWSAERTAAVPLKSTAVALARLIPVIVTAVPAGPEPGLSLATHGTPDAAMQ